jgi:hypothetical protein
MTKQMDLKNETIQLQVFSTIEPINYNMILFLAV